MGAAGRGGKGESRAVSTTSAAPRWGIGCRWLALLALTLLAGCGKQQPAGLKSSAPVASSAQAAVASSPPAAAPSPAANPVARVEDVSEKYAGQVLHPNLRPGEQPCTGETPACPDFSNARVVGGFQVTRGEVVEENLVLVDVDTLPGQGCDVGIAVGYLRTVRDPSGTNAKMLDILDKDLYFDCGIGIPSFDLLQLGPEYWGFGFSTAIWSSGAYGRGHIIYISGPELHSFSYDNIEAPVWCYGAEGEDADCRWHEMNATSTFEPGTNPDFYDIVIDERTEYFGLELGKLTNETRRYRMAEGGYQILAGPYLEPPKPTEPER
jgi:hypothetical protein